MQQDQQHNLKAWIEIKKRRKDTGKDGDMIQMKLRQSTTVALGLIPFSNYNIAKNLCEGKICKLLGEDVACDVCGGTPTKLSRVGMYSCM